MKKEQIRGFLKEKDLKITPQRLAVFEAVIKLDNHPTADKIAEFIRKNHPNIAIGTVYKTLETFVEKRIIQKVKTDKDVMRYDAIIDKHHHLYCSESDRIEDYFDDELNQLIKKYFEKRNIENFEIEDFKLHISGKFK